MPARRRRRSGFGARPPAVEPGFGDWFENASDLIIVNDRTGLIVAANRAAREFAGYTLEDQARGVFLRDVLPPPDCEAAMIVTQRALDGLDFPKVYEREVILRGGGRRVLELRSNVLQQDGGARLLQTIGRDVTEKKAAAAFESSLLQVAQALLTAQSLDALGHVICTQAREFLQVDGAYLWLRRGEELVGFAGAGYRATEFVGIRYPLTLPFIEYIERDGQARVINDFQQSAYVDERAAALNVQSILAVPLRRGERPLGLLAFVDYRNPRRFDEAVRDRATIFGAQVAMAIESALGREREEEEGRVSSALLRVAQSMRDSLEEAQVLQQIARGACEAMECDWAVVALWDATKSAFRVTTVEGWPAAAAEELKLLEFGRGSLNLVEEMMKRKTAEITQPRGRVGLYERWDVASLLAVPMIRAGHVIGCLVVGFHERRGAFAARERRIAEGIAAQAAVAVENARLVEALRRANELKSEFLSTMSHELRTPLNAILGYADLMRDGAMGAVAPEQAQALERMLQNGRALLQLINMTLDANRLEAGRLRIEPSDFSLSELLAELHEEFAVGMPRLGVPLSFPERVELPPLRTDRGKVKLILRNLIENALKFTAAGSVTVSVRGLDGGERVALSVSDTGSGIPAEAVPAIFEMFRQLDGEAAASRKGVGLGLYLVRRYAELMGGTVTVDSTPGQGSTFTVEIPCRLPG
ncbi:MAG: GAF domain-containing protein [Deltaproteobacteria bacterium]|nr:GAF domain-containing protein [Deltaproteobacteria bacterium]